MVKKRHSETCPHVLLSRRDLLRGLLGLAAASGIGAILSGCESDNDAVSSVVPSMAAEDQAQGGQEKEATMPQHGQALPPVGEATVRIEGVGTFSFDAGAISSVRPEIFQPGRYSLFDILVHLSERGEIDLDYYFDEAMDTHVIDAINGLSGWWYDAYYAGGWSETSTFRMDLYPYKPKTQLRVYRHSQDRVDEVYQKYAQEVTRLEANNGQVIIPKIWVASPEAALSFEDVVVTPHDTRLDLLQPSVITALDALLSLKDQGHLDTVRLTWYDRIGRADVVNTYFVEQVNGAEAHSRCGFVYETGAEAFSGFRGAHIHIPSDVRVLVSPEYAHWFWICL